MTSNSCSDIGLLVIFTMGTILKIHCSSHLWSSTSHPSDQPLILSHSHGRQFTWITGERIWHFCHLFLWFSTLGMLFKFLRACSADVLGSPNRKGNWLSEWSTSTNGEWESPSNASISHPLRWSIMYGTSKAASRIEPQLSTMETKSLY